MYLPGHSQGVHIHIPMESYLCVGYHAIHPLCGNNNAQYLLAGIQSSHPVLYGFGEGSMSGYIFVGLYLSIGYELIDFSSGHVSTGWYMMRR